MQIAKALIGRGYHVEMVHTGITTCLMHHEAVQSQLHEWGHAETSLNYDLVARGKKTIQPVVRLNNPHLSTFTNQLKG